MFFFCISCLNKSNLCESVHVYFIRIMSTETSKVKFHTSLFCLMMGDSATPLQEPSTTPIVTKVTRKAVVCLAEDGKAEVNVEEKTFQAKKEILLLRGNGISSYPKGVPVNFKTGMCCHTTETDFIGHVKIVEVGSGHVSDCSCGADHDAVVTIEADVCDCLNPDPNNPVYQNGCTIC